MMSRDKAPKESFSKGYVCPFAMKGRRLSIIVTSAWSVLDVEVRKKPGSVITAFVSSVQIEFKCSLRWTKLPPSSSIGESMGESEPSGFIVAYCPECLELTSEGLSEVSLRRET